ncbi:class I SAM-dependent methyltransferase [Planococcus lenghuensis]|uniref:SAM-dependent methyltransferase n=1 Tax=Planococcus lenghuensis TaxID=2213202 RepID=A0A1Q2KWP9_9BACL|nr:class I SAM-dependent methyltransferase [Planococcus lenghuensis]AQQ52638.1 SAM-dependent methyltransferase [Planococcus lenghuensis]
MSKLFTNVYDPIMKPLETGGFGAIRENLLREATGRVLEIGAGTGVNFPYYDAAVEAVDAIEPDDDMRNQSHERVREATVPIRLHAVRAENLPFPDQSFDTVVATLVFCTIPHPTLALREIERVSKPGARVLFFEHVRLDQPALGKIQDALTPLWKKAADGCHLNRDTLGMIQQSKLDVTNVDSHYKGVFLTIHGNYPE